MLCVKKKKMWKYGLPCYQEKRSKSLDANANLAWTENKAILIHEQGGVWPTQAWVWFVMRGQAEHEGSYLALIRYWATLILAGEPVIVTCRMGEPSAVLAILMWAPETWRISLILLPCLPIIQPINWTERKSKNKPRSTHYLQIRQLNSCPSACIRPRNLTRRGHILL